MNLRLASPIRLSPASAICASLVLMLGIVGAVVTLFSHAQDADQIVNEQTIVDSAIKDALAKLGDALRPNTYWDDAYNHLTETVDEGWAVKNLGPYAHDTSGVDSTFVVSESGRFFYSYLGPGPNRDAGVFHKDPAIKRLIGRALASKGVPPSVATGFVKIGDQIYMGAASRIVPNDDRALKPLSRTNVEIYLQPFGSARIAKVQRDFNIGSVSLSSHTPPNGFASLMLRDAAGAPIGYLWWKPATPGRAFALSIAPFAVATVALIGLLLILTLKRWGATQLELERRHAETVRLRQECRARSAFIGTVSHELRTPLNAILGFSGILLGKSFGPLGASEYEEYVGYIRNSGEVLLNNINDLIEFSRIESADMSFSRQPVQLQLAVSDAVSAVSGKAEKRGIKLTEKCRLPSVRADTDIAAFHEILMRLLDNAIKFSPENSEVEIESFFEDGPVVTITDRGVGIGADALKLLGKPFFQAEGHLQRHHAGLGLGLAISHALARQLEMKIDIRSVPDEGTVVTLKLPEAVAAGLEQRAA